MPNQQEHALTRVSNDDGEVIRQGGFADGGL